MKEKREKRKENLTQRSALPFLLSLFSFLLRHPHIAATDVVDG
jgi:hypothetical protein